MSVVACGLRTGRAAATADALKFCKRVQRFKEVARDGGVVAEVHPPSFSRHNHEPDCDGIVQVQMLGAVFDDPLCFGALRGGADVEDACLNATGAEAAPMRLSEAQDERVFDGIARLKGLAKAAEDLCVFNLVFLGQDHEGRCR